MIFGYLLLRSLKFTVLLLMLVGSFSSCSKRDRERIDEGSKTSDFESAPVVLVPVKELPKWLQDRIFAIEQEFGGATFPIFEEARVYKGKWKDQTVYFINHPYNNCKLCDIFYEDGERVVPVCDIFSKIENWVIIWQYGVEFL